MKTIIVEELPKIIWRIIMIKHYLFLSITLLLLPTITFSLENNSVDTNTTDNNTTSIEVNTGNCIGCHGENFEKPAMGMSQIVKDMSKEYIEATLFNYKYGENDGSMDALMAWQTSKLTDDEIRNLAQKLGK